MQTFTQYIENTRADLLKTVSNLGKANGLYYKDETAISEATKSLLELNEVTITGLLKIISGQLEIIENLNNRGELLQHQVNIDELLKSIK